MKKILNWSIGSFFRTIGRIIAYLVIAYLITLIIAKTDNLKSLLFMSVKAATTPNYWITNTDVPTYFDLFDCTESTCNRVNSSNYTNEMIELNETGGRQFTVTTRPYNLQSNGIVIRTSSNARYNVGYLYQTTFYVCSDAIMDNAVNTIYPSYYGDAFTNNNVFQSSNSYSLSGLPGFAPRWEYCYAFSTIFSPGENGTYINLRLKSTSKINGYYALVGFKSESLGLYSGEVQSIVQNSGFATAKSVEEVKTATNEVKQEIQSTNDTLNNSDTSEATNEASNLFNNHQDNDFGLSGVITAPLNLIRSLTSKTCSQVVLPLPFVDKDLKLPCLSAIYREHFNGILSIYQIVLFAIVGYRICVSIFFMVKGFKDPNKDEIEVMDL